MAAAASSYLAGSGVLKALAQLGADGAVTLRNVPARSHALDVEVDVAGLGRVRGDVAWGGNWFFIAHLPEPALELGNLEELLSITRRIAAALREQVRERPDPRHAHPRPVLHVGVDPSRSSPG